MAELFMSHFYRGIDALIDYVISFTDYFIVKQHITLGEATLFCIAITRTIWISIFGVNNDSYGMIGGPGTWFLIYFTLTVTHIAAFITKSVIIRFHVCCGHAFIWCFLFIIMIMTGSLSIGIPTLAVLTCFCMFIAVRLYRDRRLLHEDKNDELE